MFCSRKLPRYVLVANQAWSSRQRRSSGTFTSGFIVHDQFFVANLSGEIANLFDRFFRHTYLFAHDS